MWKNKKIRIAVGCLGLLAIIALLVYFNMPNKNEELLLNFKKDIVVYKNDKLTKEILIDKTNAESIEIIKGDTSKVGKYEVKVKAKLGSLEKEFTSTITVKEKETSDSSKEKKKQEKKDDKENVDKEEKKSEDKPSKDNVTSNKQDKPKNENANNSNNNVDSGSSSTGGNSNNSNQSEGSSSSPVVPEEPKLTEEQYAARVFSSINSYRQSQGLPAFATNGTLQTIANVRANDMVAMGQASHYRPDGTAADAFWIEANYGIVSGGEDVFGGSQGFMPESVVDSFINSSGHRAPIVSSFNNYMAVGVRFSNGQVYVSVCFQQ